MFEVDNKKQQNCREGRWNLNDETRKHARSVNVTLRPFLFFLNPKFRKDIASHLISSALLKFWGAFPSTNICLM
jgi:hypothetical protein